ncbi:hypothetical protein M011DRAFT_15671 [Sporormia fimetaria CBS 119925]|uniref:Uncharacterized protein n=1 Tax=Sporormia fimetaria CBS 119925 TaxID=1340428 RepID=A0A6A6VS72_9PLEO|nr:hypothetical protein M011DRAFT_15671 [Sporormia fimetaria CBS 119925]
MESAQSTSSGTHRTPKQGTDPDDCRSSSTGSTDILPYIQFADPDAYIFSRIPLSQQVEHSEPLQHRHSKIEHAATEPRVVKQRKIDAPAPALGVQDLGFGSASGYVLGINGRRRILPLPPTTVYDRWLFGRVGQDGGDAEAANCLSNDLINDPLQFWDNLLT